MIIAVDFDGTIVDHCYPDVGDAVPGAIEWLRKFQSAGAKLILWTMRNDSESQGPVLTDAVRFCQSNGVSFWGVNNNPDQKWSQSPKAYAHVYIDDASFGCPLVENRWVDGRPYVDWSIVGPKVLEMIQQHKR